MTNSSADDHTLPFHQGDSPASDESISPPNEPSHQEEVVSQPEPEPESSFFPSVVTPTTTNVRSSVAGPDGDLLVGADQQPAVEPFTLLNNTLPIGSLMELLLRAQGCNQEDGDPVRHFNFVAAGPRNLRNILQETLDILDSDLDGIY